MDLVRPGRRAGVDFVTVAPGARRHAAGLPRILVMETTSLADAKARLSELVATVAGTWERVVITKNGRPAAVLMAVEDLEALVETLEVLSDPTR